MITGISTASIYVDQQEALKFWTEKIGFEVMANNPMTPQAKWIEVASRGVDFKQGPKKMPWAPMRYLSTVTATSYHQELKEKRGFSPNRSR